MSLLPGESIVTHQPLSPNESDFRLNNSGNNLTYQLSTQITVAISQIRCEF